MDRDEEDYVFYGTPIEREEDTSTRKRKAAADAGQLLSLPVWKQEVRDEEGRRRFHGAFTGGFSAGYYNTVGSKEGWAPQTFTSSRKNRAEFKQQSIYQFLDDDDMKNMGGQALETSTQFDTFGFTAAEYARKQADKEQEKRPSAIPGPAPDDIVLPAADSIGMKLLQKMGWRRGHSIRETQADSLYDARREARKALIAFSSNINEPDIAQIESSVSERDELTERSDDGIYSSGSTPVYVLNPKQDLHGLGFDPFKHAPEFRDRKELHEARIKDQENRRGFPMGKNLLASSSGNYAPGFGIGALEELDVEDEDIYASSVTLGYELEETEVEEVEPTKIIRDNHKLEYRKQGVLSGFKVASNPDYNVERFKPPVIPPNFEPVHKFSSPLEPASKFAEALPPEVPPPEDSNLKMLIDGLATLVARCGKLFEDLSKEKNKANPLFSFLSGGNGHGYYVRKLWEEKQKYGDQQKQMDMKFISSVPKLTAEGRGRILGERPLEKSTGSSSSIASKEVIHLQSNLSDTFTKSASLARLSESVKPFKSDPAKQKRFEQFVKDKYQGGLRAIYIADTDGMSDSDRARERLDFEAAVETIEKGECGTKTNSQSVEQFLELARNGDMHFVPSLGMEKHQISQNEEKLVTKIYPKREEFQWRPSPILCKRFDIIDPFMGKPPPPPRARSKVETLIFTTDSAKNDQPAETEVAKSGALRVSQPKILEETKLNAGEVDNELTLPNVERPVDLYKAIFSDDSEDEGDLANLTKADDQEKKAEGANKALNRLVAGDFLESLGKELGLEVPSVINDGPLKTNTLTFPETSGEGDNKISFGNERSGFELQKANMHWENKEPTACKSNSLGNAVQSVSPGICRDMIDGVLPPEGDMRYNTDSRRSRSISARGRTENISSEHQEGEYPSEEKDHRANRHKTRSRHRRSSSSSDSDYSSDSGHHDRSRSKADKRSSEGKSRKHSKHHKHKRRRSRSRYPSYDDAKDRNDDHRRKDKKYREGTSDATYSKHDGRRKYH